MPKQSTSIDFIHRHPKRQDALHRAQGLTKLATNDRKYTESCQYFLELIPHIGGVMRLIWLSSRGLPQNVYKWLMLYEILEIQRDLKRILMVIPHIGVRDVPYTAQQEELSQMAINGRFYLKACQYLPNLRIWRISLAMPHIGVMRLIWLSSK